MNRTIELLSGYIFLKGLTIKLHKYGVTFMLCSVMTCPTLNLGHKHENCYVVKLIL